MGNVKGNTSILQAMREIYRKLSAELTAIQSKGPGHIASNYQRRNYVVNTMDSLALHGNIIKNNPKTLTKSQRSTLLESIECYSTFTELQIIDIFA